MRSIEGRMNKGVPKEKAVCAVCGDVVLPGIRVRAMIEYLTKEDRLDVVFAHPACQARYARLHPGPDLTDHRDDGPVTDAMARRFWVDVGKKKGLPMDRLLPLC